MDRELLLSDPQAASLFYQIIDKRIEAMIKNLKFDKTYSATVVGVNGEKADIKLQGGINTISGVPNKTGEVLSSGNEVLVEAINNSLNNLVIKYKK
nr:hypothetical protein [Mycobacterium sp. E3298]